MESKFQTSLTYLIVIIWHCNFPLKIGAQEDASVEPFPTQIQPENLANLAKNSEVLILIPSNTNFSEWYQSNANYNLFKLNSKLLLKRDPVDAGEQIDSLAEDDHHSDSEIRKRVVRDLEGGRESRFLRNIWNKPRTSPLYLVNGTVCRFVNGAPVCTTLSTSGLLPSGGGATTPRPAASGIQGGGSSTVQFASTQAPRPAGLMDDDAQDINVEGIMNNSTDGSGMVVRGQQQRPGLQPVAAIANQPFRPVNFVVNRRPLNLLALRRPVRRYQAVSGRSGGQLEPGSTQYQVRSRGGRSIA